MWRACGPLPLDHFIGSPLSCWSASVVREKNPRHFCCCAHSAWWTAQHIRGLPQPAALYPLIKRGPCTSVVWVRRVPQAGMTRPTYCCSCLLPQAPTFMPACGFMLSCISFVMVVFLLLVCV